MIKFENFKTFVLRLLEKDYGKSFSSYEEYIKDIENGTLIVSIADMFALYDAFENQKPSLTNEVEETLSADASSCDCDECMIIKMNAQLETLRAFKQNLLTT